MIKKTFHQIWINDREPDLPVRFRAYRDTWLIHHPQWDYKLWNLKNLDFKPACENILSQCRHPAQMADLLRLEILHHHGGIYVDTDFECLRPLDDLIENIDLFGCSEDGRCISTGILGSSQLNPILGNIIESFPKEIGGEPINISTGPGFITRVILTNGFNRNFTLFPTEFFYPFNYHTQNRAAVDLSRSFAVHHYADSWKSPVSGWRKLMSRVKRAL